MGFEGVGRTGPSIMFEPGPSNQSLLKEFGRGNPWPVAQSWLQTVYELTPINTDFNEFKNQGITGLNFAYWSDATGYHTPMDNPETIDPRSLQHDGSQALYLTRHFGDLDLNTVLGSGGRDAVYFTLFRGLLISYPTT